MKYWDRRKQARLYKQWKEHAELPTESSPAKSIPPPEMPPDVKVGIDVKTGLAEDNWFYRFRIRIWEAVGKILGVK